LFPVNSINLRGKIKVFGEIMNIIAYKKYEPIQMQTEHVSIIGLAVGVLKNIQE
jgi:hypothetical protein